MMTRTDTGLQHVFRIDIACLVASALLIRGCTYIEPDAPDLSGLSDDDSLREAVFRYQTQHNASGQQQTAGVYFLSVRTFQDSAGYWRDGDPGPGLLERFAGNMPPVKPFSRCSFSAYGVVDRETGARGLLFNVGAIRRLTDRTAEVDGGYYEGMLSASGNTYYLEIRGGKWIVTKDVMHWIS